ncbi:MAG: ribosome silencing factor [Synergistota bacterium]|nr:ribosome silencing factor [Synergistota bacterium]
MDNHEDRLAGLDFLYKALADKRGLDIVALDLEGSSAVSDVFVMVTANSDVHMDTLRDTALETLHKHGFRTTVEGNESSRWRLIDADELAVHVFSKSGREFYNLEKIWRDARAYRHTYED